MRIVFLGTSEFAVTVLESLVASGHEPVLVVTAPARPSGRGRRLEEPPVGAAAIARGLPVFQPERVNDPAAREHIALHRPDLLVVVAYGQILGKTLLGLAPCGAVNVHGSLLPKYRGPAPVARALENDEPSTGVTLQFMVREVDAGDIIATKSCEIDSSDTAETLSARLAVLGASLVLEQLDNLASRTAPRIPQDPARATYAPLLSKTEGRIPWGRDARRVASFVRAMTPWPAAYTEWGSDSPPNRIIARRVVVTSAESTAAPGTVTRADDQLEVATGRGIVRIERLVRPGKKELSDTEFLRGTQIETGTVLR